MSTTATLPSFFDTTNALKNSGIPLDASQLHGLLCGLIAGSGNTEKGWDILCAKHPSLQNSEVVRALFELSYQQIHEFSFEFSLLLPDDTADINVRAEALGVWCQSFLTGLEQTGTPIKKRPPSELTETLNDLIEITKVSYGEIANDEEDEAAYFELVEYVRLAALMVFHELSKQQVKLTSKDNRLH